MMLAESLNISPEQALDVYYMSDTAKLLANPQTGLQLMSDRYVLEDLLAEIAKDKLEKTQKSSL